jgi:hypothetical protein
MGNNQIAWVLERDTWTNECETLEVFIGTESEAAARAAELTDSSAYPVLAVPYPVRYGQEAPHAQ